MGIGTGWIERKKEEVKACFPLLPPIFFLFPALE